MQKHFNVNYKGRRYVNILLMIIVAVLVETAVFFYASSSLTDNARVSLEQIARQGADIVESKIQSKLEMLKMLSTLPMITDSQNSISEKIKILDMDFNNDEFRRISIVDVFGNAVTTDGQKLFVGDREYFRKAVAGQANVSDPIISRIDQDYVLAYAVPLFDSNKKVVGVLYATHSAEELFETVDDSKLEEYRNSFILNSKGNIIAHKDRTLVEEGFNIAWEAERNPELSSMEKLAHRMVVRGYGNAEYSFRGIDYYAGFSPIAGTGWSIAVSAPKKSVFNKIDSTLFLILLLVLGLLLVMAGSSVYSGILHRQIKNERDLFNAAVKVANMIAFKLDSDFRILNLNEYAEEKTGFSKADLAGQKNFLDMLEASKQKDFLHLVSGEEDGREIPESKEFPLLKKDGGSLNAIWNIQRNDEINGYTLEIFGLDITERVQYEKQLQDSHDELTQIYEELTASDEELRQQYEEITTMQERLIKTEERFRIATEGSNAVIWDFDILIGQYYFSDKWYQMLGYEKGELNEKFGGWRDIIHVEDADRASKNRNDHLNGTTPYYACEYRMRHKNGEYFWFDVRGKALRDPSGKPIRFAGSLIDITKRKEYEARMIDSYQELEATYEEIAAAEEELKYQMREIQDSHIKIKENEEKYSYLAHHDILTGLPNKYTLFEEAHQASFHSSAESQAVFFIDMDNFKYINDTMGHVFGDQLIVKVSNRLSSLLSDKCSLYRLSGDEFIIINRNVSGLDEAERMAAGILEEFRSKIAVQDSKLYVGLSIGIALYPEHGRTVGDLVNCADIAMYKAKDTGRNRYSVYSPEMKNAFSERADLERCIHMALERNEFEVYYQPQLDLKRNKVRGLEALLRWKSPELGSVSPVKFIKVAEDTHQITKIGRWVLNQSCAFLKQLHNDGYSELSVSVNISILQLLQTDFTEMVLDTLDTFELNPEYLELEITESILMESFEAIGGKLASLKDKGVRVALDDFGKGYSSLSYLKELPISTLKIDKIFIDYITHDTTSRTLTGHIVTLGQSLGMDVVAEGVENREQYDYLKSQGCNMIQGYMFCRPVPRNEIERFLSEYR